MSLFSRRPSFQEGLETCQKKPGAVLEQEPKYGTQISPDSAVTIYVNSYKGDDSSDSLGTDFN